MAGLLMTIFNVIRLNTMNRTGESNLVPYIQTRLREIELKNTDKLLAAIDGKEPETKCEYCGFIVKVSDRVCGHCGANLY
jgi:rubrerythrin